MLYNLSLMSYRFPSFSPGQYVKAVITIVGATTILYLLKDTLDTPIVALLYLLPVVLSTRLWGLGAGIAAAFCAFLAFNFFFILPYHTFLIHQTQDLLVLIVFLIVAVLISQLVARMQSSLATAQAREREATHLYELSTALVGMRSLEAIAHTVVEQIHQLFQAQAVEMTIQVESGKPPITIRLPADISLEEKRPEHQVALVAARGRLGEICLWRFRQPFTPAEDRLLKTFASQGAMAMEYTLLAEAETRAKVLEESDRLKSALLSSVSHELRSPLVTIKAAASTLLGDELVWASPARQELLTAVETEADHLNQLVGNLLDMSRIEANALQPHRQWNILAEIVNSVVSRMRRAAERHFLEIDISEDLPLVPVDHVQIDQVFTNLLSNCLKYAPVNTPICVRAWVVGEQLQVQACNQGPPVPEQDLDRIFDKFQRVTMADKVTGTGLGLSICKGIIEAHGGHIWAENLPTGFAFNFVLPLVWDGVRPSNLPHEEA